jgi:D-glycero-D-manno-heptose 1,7-bisphosphate phosphatase
MSDRAPAARGLRPALLLDRDGTLIAETGHRAGVAGLRLLPGVATALLQARRAGFLLILVTNQSGIARGLLSEADAAAVHAALQQRLARRGVALDGIYLCPHHPQAGEPPYRVDCSCRKPRPGLLLRAADEHGIDLGRSFMLGDQARDVQAGRAAGCRTVLLARRRSAAASCAPDHVDSTLSGGIAWILRQR